MQRVLAFLTLAASCASAAEMFPFTLPWDDASPTVISLAHLNDKPAGGAGFVHVKNGHLFTGEKRLRIFGVNVCFGANFPTHEAAEKVAARMAKFGINCVRFHHMDMFSAPGGIFAKDGKTLDADRLDRLDYFIAKLKEHGIYTDLNLHVSRSHPDRPKSEKKTNPDYDKGVDNYSPGMIAFQKDYARDLLTHVNPYTGKRYAEEPAVALVEINNENALGFQWWAGEMDDLPAPYAAELEKLWGAWLTAKYESDEPAKEAWAKGAQPLGDEMVDTDFDKQDIAWFLEKQGGAQAESRAGMIPAESVAATLGGPPRNPWNEGNKAVSTATIRVLKAGSEAWHVQLSHAGLKLEAGRIYTASFFAKADKPRKITVNLSQAHEPWQVFGSSQVELTPDWKRFDNTFRVASADQNARISFSNLSAAGVEFSFADVSLRPGGVDGTLVRDSEGLVRMLKKREFSRYTAIKQRDWQQFLWDTETKYWNGMRDFLKSDLGVKSLIVGTQGFWSPAHVQEGMDVVDSHAYWHHPDFHGRGWNQDVWSVKNESMAGAKEGGELARLAAQRVAGKPFICTEYNHPAPNTYSAETFPLALAFAAAQDWDGVFAFAYSHRGDSWDQPHFNSFFDIDRHSVKMATLPGAVTSFRRGDIAPLGNSVLLKLSSEDIITSGMQSGPGFVRNRPEFKSLDLFRTRFGVQAEPVEKTELITTGKAASEIQWHVDHGYAAATSERSKLLVGKVASENHHLGGVTLTPGSTRQNWACYQITALDGADLSSAKHILITATGESETTGMRWTDEKKTSVGRNWGGAPVLAEGPAAILDLPGKGTIKAWALDETGKRRVEIPTKGNLIEIGPQHRTLWYEVVREQ